MPAAFVAMLLSFSKAKLPALLVPYCASYLQTRARQFCCLEEVAVTQGRPACRMNAQAYAHGEGPPRPPNCYIGATANIDLDCRNDKIRLAVVADRQAGTRPPRGECPSLQIGSRRLP